MCSSSIRFRLSDDAAMHKRVLRVPASLLEYLLQGFPRQPSPVYRELALHDIVHLDRRTQTEGKRLVGLYVVLGPHGIVTEIGVAKPPHMVGGTCEPINLGLRISEAQVGA